MAHDNTIPHPAPGIASFQTESWGQKDEILFGDTPAIAERNQTVTSTAGITLPIYSVVNIAANNQITLAVIATGESNATHITAAPIVLGAGETMEAPMYEAGHFRQQALNFDATFTTDASKQNAFKGSGNPMILISKAKYTEADFPA